MLLKLSLKEDNVPIEWKRAKVVPVLKRGDREEALNNRLASLISMVCKILDKMIRRWIEEFLNGITY